MKWLPSLFSAEAIPSAMITFVALLMFVQLGESWGMSTLLSGLLTLPWVLKSFLREKVRRMGAFVDVLHGIEVGVFVCLVALAFCFTVYTRHRTLLVVSVLFVLCLFCAWHELAARMYFERMLRPRVQRLYNTSKMFVSQSSVIITYGAMLLGVGGLQVFYHNRHQAIPLAWSTSVYMLSGIYLVLLLYNFFVLRVPNVGNDTQDDTLVSALRAEVKVIDRIVHKPHWLAVVICLFLLLLPQSLMFHTRVIFLFAPLSDGGLGCTLQWIALAQGTVGVMAFSLGLGLGHSMENRKKVFSQIRTAHVALVISPFVYYIMTQWPPQGLSMLCVATFIAQFTFGFGLNACMPYVRYISGERYRSTINYLYIPLVASVMLVPIAISGFLLDSLGFDAYFLLDSLTAVPAIIAGFVGSYILKDRNY